MGYTKQNFKDGDVLTAAQLTAMEDGILEGGAAGLTVTVDPETLTTSHSYTQLLEAYLAGQSVRISVEGLQLEMMPPVQEGVLMFQAMWALEDLELLLAAVTENDPNTLQPVGQFPLAQKDHTHSADAELSDTSENPVQNRSIKAALDQKADKSHSHPALTFTGAVSGVYDGSGSLTLEIPQAGGTATVLSDNLFDPTTAVNGKYFYHSASGPTLLDDQYAYYNYVALRGAGTYRFRFGLSLHGDDYGKRVPLLKSDKTFVRNATATILDSTDRDFALMEFTVTESDITNGVYYMCIDGFIVDLDLTMVVKDREYPATYIPYGHIEAEAAVQDPNNPLAGKTALFFGDSICAGTTVDPDSHTYGYGWAGLIGEGSGMVWENYGWNGAVITQIEGAERVLATRVDEAMLKYPAADYIIFQGGCNDADQLAGDAAGLGTVTEGYAVSGYDTARFSGAFEALILKLVNAYPGARIGYIVSPKMNASLSVQTRYRTYFDRAAEICRKWGIPVLDLWHSIPMNPALQIYHDGSANSFYTDGQHLTQKGYDRLAPTVQAWMKTL